MKTKWISRNLVVSVAVSFASVAEGDVVTDWNGVALAAIRTSNTAPPPASRALASLHTSIYDAVNGILRTHEPFFVREKGPTNASEEAAASAAANKVLITLSRQKRPRLTNFTKPPWLAFGTMPASDEVSSGANLWQTGSSRGAVTTGLRLPNLCRGVAALGYGDRRRLTSPRILLPQWGT